MDTLKPSPQYQPQCVGTRFPRDAPVNTTVLVSVVMPCLNEARTVAACIDQAHAGCRAALAKRIAKQESVGWVEERDPPSCHEQSGGFRNSTHPTVATVATVAAVAVACCSAELESVGWVECGSVRV